MTSVDPSAKSIPFNVPALSSLVAAGIVAVLRAPTPDAALGAVDALVAGGDRG